MQTENTADLEELMSWARLRDIGGEDGDYGYGDTVT